MAIIEATLCRGFIFLYITTKSFDKTGEMVLVDKNEKQSPNEQDQ